ncbi:MAG: SDR family NAD(P)-dependent oxidoreductase [Deltaproteobacteria bacterium]|nr:SDR family NAD(P)-dependent oxidoreductase [Deltaproteobacteria bacterium]
MSDTKDVLRQALHEIRQLKQRVGELEHATDEPIAIVGIGCRLPGAPDPEAYWRLLEGGVDAVRPVPEGRFDTEALYDPRPGVPGKMITKEGGFLEAVDGFEPELFGITPREVPSMDPQQRLMLEVAREALEDAGIAPDRLSGSNTGVFVGIASTDYAQLGIVQGGVAAADTYALTGNAPNVAAGRLSYVFGLEGPAMAVDTACSSSLVATHLAVESLRSRECDLALAGGVNLLLSPASFISFSQLKALAPDGRSKSFDAAADGFGRGEGAGVVVLRRLSDARRAGDRVIAVIRGSAVNQGGKSGGLTVPNGRAQQEVLRKACARARVAPSSIGYVEAHGTGTALGDPIEVLALAGALGEGRSEPLRIGSAKSNLGHLEAAAGIAGLIKTALLLERGVIPPSLHLRTPNPQVPWDQIDVRVVAKREAWPVGAPRRAGVSAFGFSGINAHVVLEAPPERPARIEAPDPTAQPEVVLLSAHTEAALRGSARALERAVTASPDPLSDVAHTLRVGRARLGQRVAMVARDQESLAGQLRRIAAGGAGPGVTPVKAPLGPGKLAFVFSGQAAQYGGMGRQLYAAEPAFREAFDGIDRVIAPRLGRSLRDELAIDQTVFTQPSLLALELSLVELLRSAGVVPDAVIGHSVGELAAAVTAGVLSAEDAALLVVDRAKLMQELPQNGAMLAVACSEAEILDTLEPLGLGLDLAAVNGPKDVVVSGLTTSIESLARLLEARGIEARRLSVSHAFHSSLLEPCLSAWRERLGRIRFSPPRVPVAANVDGAFLGAETDWVAYFSRQMRAPVRFYDGLRRLAADGVTTFLEVGPGGGLAALIKRSFDRPAIESIATLRRNEPEPEAFRLALGALALRDVSVDLLFGDAAPRRKLRLPTTPYQRRRFWLSDAPRTSVVLPRSTWPGRRIPTALAATLFELDLRADDPVIDDHRLFGVAVAAAATQLSLLLAAARICLSDGPLELTGVRFLEPLVVLDREARHLQIVAEAQSDGLTLRLMSLDPQEAGRWAIHAEAQARAVSSDARGPQPARKDGVPLDARALYAGLAARGYGLGPSFSSLDRIVHGQGWASAEVLTRAEGDPTRASLSPGRIDAALQLLSATADASALPMLVPAQIDRVRLFGALDPNDVLRAEARLVSIDASAGEAVGEARLLDAEGRTRLELESFRARAIGEDVIQSALRRASRTSDLYRIEWVEAEPASGPRDDGPFWLLPPKAPSPWLGPLLEALPGARTIGALDPLPDAAATILDLRGTVGSDRGELDLFEQAWSLVPRLPAGCRLWLVTEGAAHPSPSAGPGDRGGRSDRSDRGERGDRGERSDRGDRGERGDRGDRGDPAGGALLIGLGRVLELELPDRFVGRIDLPADASRAGAPGDALRSLVDRLRARGPDRELAIRGGRAFVPRLAPVPAKVGPSRRAVDNSAVCFVTGAFGPVGRAIIERLIERGARRFALVSRRVDHPEATAWLAELETRGVRAQVCATDVADAGALEKAWRDVESSLGPITGVVHAAGTLKDGLVGRGSFADAAMVLRGKVLGARNLDRLASKVEIFALISSAAAVLGAPGQGAYAAANAYLDALAAARRARGQAGTSVAFGPWAGPGMAERQAPRARSAGIEALDPARALDALEEAIASGEAHRVILRADWPLLLARLGATPPGLLAGLVRGPTDAGSEAQRSALIAELRAVAPQDRPRRLAEWLREKAEIVTGLSPAVLALDRPLRDLGLDSLMALELRNLLTRALGVSLPATLLFEHPTLSALADLLMREVFADLQPKPEDQGRSVGPGSVGPGSAALDQERRVLEMSEAEAQQALEAKLASLLGGKS